MAKQEKKSKFEVKNELTLVKLPSHFPFQEIMCLEEHKKIFNSLFIEVLNECEEE